MKKRGFTLIEILVVMSIISILSTISFTSYKHIKKIKDNRKLKYSATLCSDFILLSKNTCKNKDRKGYIFFDEAANALYFFCDKKRCDQLYLSDDIRIIYFNYKDRIINISNFGRIENGGTIGIRNKNDEIKEVIIGVYTNYIQEN